MIADWTIGQTFDQLAGSLEAIIPRWPEGERQRGLKILRPLIEIHWKFIELVNLPSINRLFREIIVTEGLKLRGL